MNFGYLKHTVTGIDEQMQLGTCLSVRKEDPNNYRESGLVQKGLVLVCLGCDHFRHLDGQLTVSN